MRKITVLVLTIAVFGLICLSPAVNASKLVAVGINGMGTTEGGTTEGQLAIFDINNPNDVHRIGQLQTQLQTGPAIPRVRDALEYHASPTNLSIIDVSNPRNPTKLGVLNEPLMYVDFMDNYVFGSTASRILSINVSDHTNPTLENEIDYGTPDVNGELAVVKEDNLAYNIDDDGHFRTIDISNPENISQIGYENIAYGGAGCKGVEPVENYAYVAYENGLKVVDISDPKNPINEATLNLPFNQASDVLVEQEYAYVLGDVGLYIVDVSNPQDPVVVDNTKDEGLVVWDFKPYGDNLAVGVYGLNFYIFDTSNPSDLSLISQTTIKDPYPGKDTITRIDNFSLSTLTVNTNLPSDLEPTCMVTDPDFSTASHSISTRGYTFYSYPSGTAQVKIQEDIGRWHFQEWKWDISSTNNPANIHLSDRAVKAVYAEETGPMPPPVLPSQELDIDGTTGTMRNGEFVPESSFVGGETVFVRAKVTVDGSTTTEASVTGSWNGSSFNLAYSDGYYRGSFTLPKDVSLGSYTVNETANLGDSSSTDSQTISVEPFVKPPKPGEFPSWYKYAALASLLLAFFIVPGDRWDRTPKNWWEGSGPGSWTFSDDALILIALSLIATGFIFFVYGVGFGSIFYSIFAVAIIIALVTELFEPGEPLASICFDGEKEGRLMLSGILFGVFFVWVSSWLGELFAGTLWPYSIISYLMASIPENIAFLSTMLFIPVLEAGIYRGVATPTVAEKVGIWPSVMGVAFLFGISHVLFGAGLTMLVIATLFGVVTGWMVLRNQSLLFPVSAHIIYNSIVVLISLGMI